MRVRRVVTDKVKEILSSYNAILTPACSKTEYAAYDASETFSKVYEESVYTAIPSLTGLPALVCSGVQLIADAFKESTLLSIADKLEKEEA